MQFVTKKENNNNNNKLEKDNLPGSSFMLISIWNRAVPYELVQPIFYMYAIILFKSYLGELARKLPSLVCQLSPKMKK